MNEKILLMYSGGKDSTALLVEGLKRGLIFDKIVFCDTGLEFPEMYDYIDMIEKLIGQEIIRKPPTKDFDMFFYGTYISGKYEGERRGFPFVTIPCWHARHSKVRSVKQEMIDADIIYLGITKGEEHRGINWKFSEKYRYPLIEWGFTDKDCLQYCKTNKIFNPLYLKFKRLGCWLCPKQPFKSLQRTLLDYPQFRDRFIKLYLDAPRGFCINNKLESKLQTWLLNRGFISHSDLTKIIDFSRSLEQFMEAIV